MKYNYFHINDATYAYTITGQGEPLLLLHGFTGSSETWKNLIRYWSKNFQVITIDLPGHGKTNCTSSKSMETFCEDLTKLLTHLQIGPCHILGYSMGGRVALSFSIYYPAYVKSLILESASPGLQTVEERDARIKSDTLLAERIMNEGLDSFVQFWEDIPLFQRQKSLPQHVQENIRLERLSQSDKGLADSLLFMGTGKQQSWWSELSQVNIPVLLLVGEDDLKFVEINKRMKDALPHAQLVVIKNANHVIHVEQVGKFVKIVMEYVQNNT